MAEQIPRYDLFPGIDFSCYEISVASDYSVSQSRIGGVSPTASDSGEIIIKLDWSQLAVTLGNSIADIAKALVPMLLSTNFIPELGGRSLVEFPFHLIGHSRGGSVITEMTWDSLLNHYIGGKMTEDRLWNPVASVKIATALPVLKCPSDATPRPDWIAPPLPVNRRSYAMPGYMDLYGKLAEGRLAPWPPSSDSQTGVGLNFSPLSPFWNNADNKIGDGSPANPRPSHQLAVKGNMILEPSGTIVLTERIHVHNVMGFVERHIIGNAEEHMATGPGPVYTPPYFYPPADKHHGGRFNYLMVDGHVEFLLPGKTTPNLGLPRGMWSIKTGD